MVCDECPKICAFAEPHTNESKEKFWNDIPSDIDLDTIKEHSCAISIRGSTSHMAMCFLPHDHHQGYTIELVYGTDEQDSRDRVHLYTRPLKTGWKTYPIPVKVTSSRRSLYDKALKVISKFGWYQGALNNCHDFVVNFCREIGINKPYHSVVEKTKAVTLGITASALWYLMFPLTVPLTLANRKFHWDDDGDDLGDFFFPKRLIEGILNHDGVDPWEPANLNLPRTVKGRRQLRRQEAEQEGIKVEDI